MKKEYEKTKGEESREKLKEYLDIRDTYNDISKGDYISKLVKEEKLRREQEQKKQPQKKKPNKRR